MRGVRERRLDLLVAVVLTVVVELEVVLGPAEGGSRMVTGLAAPMATLPLAWRRRVPLLPLASLAIVLLVQAPLNGFLVEHPLTPLAVLLLALYSAGRHLAARWEVAGAALAMAVLAATRLAFDPAVESAVDAVLTVVALPLAFLVGRAVRGQHALRQELDQRARRIERGREREAARRRGGADADRRGAPRRDHARRARDRRGGAGPGRSPGGA